MVLASGGYTMSLDKPIKFDGKMYCEHYDSAYYNCVNCMEQAVFKYKTCYKEAKK